MELKKNDQANLEKKKSIFLLTGFVIVLSVILLAFEWTTSPDRANDLGDLGDINIEDEIIPVTRQEEVKPPPPPPRPQITEILNIVEDDVEIEDEIEIQDSETDQKEEITFVEVEEEEEEAQVFFIAEDMPLFPGCKSKEETDAAIQKFIRENIKYPEIARENGIQGRVFVSFVVSKTGKITNVKLLRGVDSALDQEAMRVIQALPDFTPGKQRGKPVRVGYNVPINFKLG
jgi:periplasmic protein TonB